MTLSSSDVIADRIPLTALYAGMAAGGTGTVTATGSGGTGTTANTTKITAFADPATGKVTIAGPASLTDAAGALYEIAPVNGVPVVFVNGVSQGLPGVAPWAVHANGPVAYLILQGGTVYCVLTTNIAQSMSGGTWRNTTLPTITSTGAPATVALPAPPAPSAIAPGSSGKVVNCGTGQTLATLSAAIPTALAGDTIMLAKGNYTDTPPAWKVPLLIDLGGSTFDATGKTATLAYGKALLVPTADSIIQNGTITGVAMDQTVGQLTSAIRPDVGCGYLTIKNMQMHENQCAIGHGGFPIEITVADSDISFNGLKGPNTGGLTHDLYVGNDCSKLTLTNVIANGANEAHAIKYRGPQLIVNGGTFASAPGKPFNLPQGGSVPVLMNNVTINKGASDSDHGVIQYYDPSDLEGVLNGEAGIVMTGGAINAGCTNPEFLGGGGTLMLAGVALTGNPIIAVGGLVVSGT